MDAMDMERLRRLLGGPGLKRLIDRLQRRFERGEEGGASIHLTAVTPEERRAVETFLGRPAGRGASLRIPLAEFEGVLRRSGAAPDLRSAVAALRGPLRDLRGEQEEAMDAWRTLFREVAPEVESCGLGNWLERLRQSGLLKRLAGGDAGQGSVLLRQSLHVLRQLPARGISLSRLAAQALGDAHGLDPGRPVATLARRGIVARRDLTEDQTPEGARATWEAAGVLVGGSLSSVVLSLNLPALPHGGTGRNLRILAETAEPGWLTLRQLLRDPPIFSCRNQTVFVCENPSVVFEAAEELGPVCPPLVCTNGQRNSALMALLEQLTTAGARLLYHGDFDWPGIAIANGIMKSLPLRSWRFDTATYLDGLGRSSKPLAGSPVAANWDGTLAAVMREKGMALEEEHLLDLLLADLRSHDPALVAG